MKVVVQKKVPAGYQYIISIAIVIGVAALCFAGYSFIGYKSVAYILLITVSLIAMVADIAPVLIAAFLSALIWDFFFIPPRFTFQVHQPEDAFLLVMYFVVSLIHAALTYKIRRAEKLVAVAGEKERALQLYNTILSSLSHELRTPIATIIAATDNLQQTGATLDGEQKTELVAEIAKASLRLNEQVENLLNMARIESGLIQPKKDWHDINEVVYGVIVRLESPNMAHQFAIHIPTDLPLVLTDAQMLHQVLYNLLMNSLLYTPPGTIISVSASCKNDLLQLVVADNGPGFPQGEIEVVFDKFYRIKGTRIVGTGLGLSIVKGYVSALGGTVTLTNQPTGGALFTIDIPTETSYLKNLKHE